MGDKQPYILGLTGGLAAGKSTVCAMFRQAGATIVDADKIVHQLQQPNTPETQTIAAHITQHSGHNILDETGAIDRQKLAKEISANSQWLTFVEDVLHPAVQREEKKQIQAAALAYKNTKTVAQRPQSGEVNSDGLESGGLVVLDVPLLFEVGTHHLCDSTAYCHAPEAVRKQRVFAPNNGRNSMTEDKWQTLLARRWPEAQALAAADHIINTNVDKAITKQQVTALCQQLSQQPRTAFLAHWR